MLLPGLHTDFSRGRSGGLVFPSLSAFSTVYCDPHKDFGIVNKAEIDVFLELSCFFDAPADLAIWSLVPLPFLKPAWTSAVSQFTYCLSLAWRILSITLRECSAWFSSVAQPCLNLCDPMNHSMPGLAVHHQHPEFTQTHVHRVGDAIQPSHPLSPLLLLPPFPSSIRVFSN